MRDTKVPTFTVRQQEKGAKISLNGMELKNVSDFKIEFDAEARAFVLSVKHIPTISSGMNSEHRYNGFKLEYHDDRIKEDK